MIAIVTSTLIPNGAYSYYSNAERMQQTVETIIRLSALPLSSIYLFDNSTNKVDFSEILQVNKEIKIFSSPQFTFENKGLNEALLILNCIHDLPVHTPIFKISGRYFPNENFGLPDDNLFGKYDFAGFGKEFDRAVPYFSTRAYFVKNKSVLQSLLVLAIEEMLSYSNGIHGIKSLFISIKKKFKKSIGTDYQLSLEQAFGRILKHKQNVMLLKAINIEGYIAGSGFKEFIKE